MKTNTKTIIGLTLAIVIISLVGVTFSITMQRLSESKKWVAHTVSVRQELERLTTNYMKSQNNIRGFYLAEQDHYLRLHQEAVVEMTRSMDVIQGLVSDNPRQLNHLNGIKQLINERLLKWQEAIKLRRTVGIQEIQKMASAEEGKLFDLRLAEDIDAMKAEEEMLFAERQREFQTNTYWLEVVSYTGGFVAVILISLAGFFIHRDAKRREIAESELDRFFNLSLDLLCISGMDGYFKRLAPAFQEVLGYPLIDLYRTPIIDMIHPDDREKTAREIERQAAGNKVLSFENRFRCIDGNYRTLSWKSVPVNGLMYAVARDVTQQKIYEQELVSARELAHEGTRTKSEFLANMSHEIRTPLNGIIGMADLMDKSKLDDEQADQLNLIRQSGMHLLRIINEVLDYSKIEAGRMQLEMLDFNLNTLFASQISLIGITAHEKRLKLHSMVDPKIPEGLRGDSGRIGQIILNLLGNSVKFTERGSITLKANLLSEENGHCWIRFSVTDSGIGMSEDQISKLFLPFMQADTSTSRRYGGTGLGLSICKRLVEMMGGIIGVESMPGLGSTFWFKIKLDVPVHGKLEIGHLADGSKPFSPSEKVIKVLVAEDNFVNQLIIVKMLEKLGCAAHMVSNGEEAVAAFKNNEFDLVFMDYHMPVMDGTEATREIRTIERTQGKRIPILAFTANVFPEDQAKCLAAGMDDFILKPVTIHSLEQTLVKWRDVIEV